MSDQEAPNETQSISETVIEDDNGEGREMRRDTVIKDGNVVKDEKTES